MHFRLRTLFILRAVGPPALAFEWREYGKHRERERLREEWQRATVEIDKLRSGPRIHGFHPHVFLEAAYVPVHDSRRALADGGRGVRCGVVGRSVSSFLGKTSI